VDDSEARYLIDELNRYAAWRTARSQLDFSGWTIAIAFFAFCLAVLSIFAVNFPMELASRTVLLALVLPILFLGLAVWAVLWIRGDYEKARREQGDDEKRLLTLEDYRSKRKSLPDGITLRKIVGLTPEELKELLEKSGPKAEDTRSPAS
jgi:hypothetical protein